MSEFLEKARTLGAAGQPTSRARVVADGAVGLEVVSVRRGGRELIVISGRQNAAALATMAEEIAARRRAEGKVVMLTGAPGLGTRDTVAADVLISVREYGAAWAGERRHGR